MGSCRICGWEGQYTDFEAHKPACPGTPAEQIERLTRERDEAAASDKESIEMYRRARDRADRAEIRRTLERIDRAALAEPDNPPAAAPSAPQPRGRK